MKRVVASLAVSLVAAVCWAGDTGRLILVERRQGNDLAALRTVGIPVVLEARSCLLVRGGTSDLADLAARGYKATVLDDAAMTHDYVMVGVRPDSDLAAIRAAGSVLLGEENWLLIRVPPGASLEPFEKARAFAGRVPSEAAAMPKTSPVPTQESAALLVPDPIVQKIVQGVANADIQAYWNAITSNPPTGTRDSTAQGCGDASAYCLGVYGALKIPAQYQTWDAGNAPNVIGTLTGAVNPGNVYIAIAHLDDLPSSGVAPGADDNGSGSAAVLAAAKALSCWGVRNTVKFLNVTGDEDGLFGSEAYAADAVTRGENILGVLNLDMIGWQGDGAPAQEDLDLDFNTPSQWLAQLFSDASSAYGTGLTVNPILCPGFNISDHYPFWERGFSAISGITDNEGYCGAVGNYPYYQLATDTIANNGNPAFYYKVVRASVATLGELADPFKIVFGAPGYACGATMAGTIADRDLNTSPTTAQPASVRVWSATEPAGETLTVTERGVNSMLFDGTMPTTTGAAVSGDGKLSVSPGDVLHAEYVDALDCDGAVNVTYAATASLDCAAPAISAVAVTGVTGISAHVTWTTNEAATSVVHYGTTPPGSQSASSSTLVTAHDVALTGLSECTGYVSWVESADAVGNTASDNAGGAYYPFTTM